MLKISATKPKIAVEWLLANIVIELGDTNFEKEQPLNDLVQTKSRTWSSVTDKPARKISSCSLRRINLHDWFFYFGDNHFQAFIV